MFRAQIKFHWIFSFFPQNILNRTANNQSVYCSFGIELFRLIPIVPSCRFILWAGFDDETSLLQGCKMITNMYVIISHADFIVKLNFPHMSLTGIAIPLDPLKYLLSNRDFPVKHVHSWLFHDDWSFLCYRKWSGRWRTSFISTLP